MDIKKHIHILAFLAVLFSTLFLMPEVKAQCQVFVRSLCVPELQPYIHDGGFQAVIMREGEEAEVYKTVFAGQQYRLFICIDSSLPNVEFVVSDIRRNILFDNQKNDNTRVWNFRPSASQQIKVTIRIPRSRQGGGEQNFGCVGVLFGLLEQ